MMAKGLLILTKHENHQNYHLCFISWFCTSIKCDIKHLWHFFNRRPYGRITMKKKSIHNFFLESCEKKA